MDVVAKLANDYNLTVIEDAAQSIGSNFKGRKVGTLGSCSCISFDPTKILGAQSNGGVILTDDPEQYKLLSEIRYHGKNLKTGEFETLGFNSRLPSLQARLLSFNLDLLEGWIERNREIAHRYISELSELEQLELLKEDENSRHIFHKFVLQVKNGKRDELKGWLSKNKIKTMIHYGKSIPENQMFRDLEHKVENLDNINRIKSKVLSLPIHAWLTDDEISYVISKIKEFYDISSNSK